MDFAAIALTVQDLGEQELLKRLQAFCPSEFVGDDAAVLTPPPDRSLVITTDMLVDGVHFSDRTTTPADAGWRAAAANLSDLAAMGATPLGITVALGIPPATPVATIEQLYQGLSQCLQQYDTPIVGGDSTRSPILTLAITAFGSADPTRLIQRHTAQPGDAIVVTGVHGASRAGLELLLHPDRGQNLSKADRTRFITAHQRPLPRLDVLPVLSSVAPTSLRVAGMDSSDGLADAVLQICRASGVGATIDRASLPLPAGLQNWVGLQQAVDWALYGGEDFELVLCMPSAIAQALTQQINGAAVIGTITSNSDLAVRVCDHTGHYPDLSLSLTQGFQHF